MTDSRYKEYIFLTYLPVNEAKVQTARSLTRSEKETPVGDRGDSAIVQLSPRNWGSYCRTVKSFAALPDLASQCWQSIRTPAVLATFEKETS